MIVVKDTMVLIHLAKLSLLEECCLLLKQVIIPERVYAEVSVHKDKYADALIIIGLCKRRKIITKKILKKKLLRKAYALNIIRGEAEAVALAWQENADFLATDDDNVRKKRELLDLNLIGTPAILLRLYYAKRLNKEQFVKKINELRKIGWFNSTITDSLLLEVEKHG